ncbi:alpha/beta hydrolase [Flavitalea flava]
MKHFFILSITTLLISMTQAQQVIPLYGDLIPNSKPAKDEEFTEPNNEPPRVIIGRISRPTLTVFPAPADKANGSSVIICPGGGYSIVAIGHEGFEVAKKFNEMGVTAFVLKYRIPNDEYMVNKEIGPLQDAQRAIQLVRQNATTWKVNPDRIGMMGFSAGGHLASTAGTHFNQITIDNKDSVSLRPDFMMLIYPVISFSDKYGHIGSRNNLLGNHPSSKKIKAYSNELQVTKSTPPTFLIHSGDDSTVPVRNSLMFYEALQEKGVPAEIHVYPKGGHGYGLHNPTTKDEWIDRLKNWLDAGGWLKK